MAGERKDVFRLNIFTKNVLILSKEFYSFLELQQSMPDRGFLYKTTVNKVFWVLSASLFFPTLGAFVVCVLKIRTLYTFQKKILTVYRKNLYT